VSDGEEVEVGRAVGEGEWESAALTRSAVLCLLPFNLPSFTLDP